MRPLLPFVQYQLERDYYVNVLCKNRSQPALHCDGKCALMEQLKAAAEEPVPGAPLLPEDISGSDFLGLHLLPEGISPLFFFVSPVYAWENRPVLPQTPDSLWRPPELAG